ncbi:hypothetical protein CROQUDRAFT_667543 [Cronartium quercuum f. sp. fusiforme G11]|uniref:Uncharacterized protein n=1 Tax=Cronartium quercuum f. sp. fusiforme G11 TaxID=708437 RepID=A0A9P6NZC4_9BASI|nr:hypothetical protein CROQUDRAFT_667543 [Cronartium quercuum f. sp. fusiforme G11]
MAEMSSMMIYTIGFVSLAGSLSVYATRKIRDSRKQTPEPTQKPLVLPWLIPSQEPQNTSSRGGVQRPVIITIQSRKEHKSPSTRPHQGSRSESLPPYISEPTSIEPTHKGLSSIEKSNFGPRIPLARLKSLPPIEKNFERVSRPPSFSGKLDPDLEYEELNYFENSDRTFTTDSLPDLEEGDSFESNLEQSECLAQQESPNRASVSSITSSLNSHVRDSYMSCNEFEELGVVIGSGLRVTQYPERLKFHSRDTKVNPSSTSS